MAFRPLKPRSTKHGLQARACDASILSKHLKKACHAEQVRSAGRVEGPAVVLRFRFGCLWVLDEHIGDNASAENRLRRQYQASTRANRNPDYGCELAGAAPLSSECSGARVPVSGTRMNSVPPIPLKSMNTRLPGTLGSKVSSTS